MNIFTKSQRWQLRALDVVSLHKVKFQGGFYFGSIVALRTEQRWIHATFNLHVLSQGTFVPISTITLVTLVRLFRPNIVSWKQK